MHGRRSTFFRRGGNMPFVLWGWAMLVVVVLSATPTSAHPRSRLIGSAFDPATVSVVVSPRKARPDEWTRKPPEDDPAGAAFDNQPDASLARPIPLAASVGARADAVPSRVASPPRRPAVRAHAPTEPPLT